MDTTLIGSCDLLLRNIFSNMCAYIYIKIMTVPECRGYFDIIHDIYFLTTVWNNTKLYTKVKIRTRTKYHPSAIMYNLWLHFRLYSSTS